MTGFIHFQRWQTLPLTIIVILGFNYISLEDGARKSSPVLLHKHPPERWDERIREKKTYLKFTPLDPVKPTSDSSTISTWTELAMSWSSSSTPPTSSPAAGWCSWSQPRSKENGPRPRWRTGRHCSSPQPTSFYLVWTFSLPPAHPCSWQSPCPPAPQPPRCDRTWWRLSRFPSSRQTSSLLDFFYRVNGFLLPLSMICLILNHCCKLMIIINIIMTMNPLLTVI